jgi:hypothetical protein
MAARDVCGDGGDKQVSWFKVDDKSWGHAKVLAAGNAAWGAFCRLGAYASDHLTDGKIPPSVAQIILSNDEADRLVSVGLLEKNTDGSVVIHDFLDWNPSAKKVLKLRKDRAKAGSKGAAKANGKRSASAAASAERLLTTRSQQNLAPRARVPSRPVPVPSTLGEGSALAPEPELEPSQTIRIPTVNQTQDLASPLSPVARNHFADFYLVLANEIAGTWTFAHRGERSQVGDIVDAYRPKPATTSHVEIWLKETLESWRRRDPNGSEALSPMKLTDWLRAACPDKTQPRPFLKAVPDVAQRPHPPLWVPGMDD